MAIQTDLEHGIVMVAYDGMHVGRFTAYLSVQTAMNLCGLYD